MRFDSSYKFFYSFKPKDPTYDEFITGCHMPKNIDSFRTYCNFINNRYGALEEPHSKIKCYKPNNYDTNYESHFYKITRIYVYETMDDMNRDFIANCSDKEKRKLTKLMYKKEKLKGEV